jgi:dTDP-4-dehydrorhamnose 3,5-epimerase-like enzyme
MLIHHSAVLKNMSLTALSQNIAENGELTVIEGLKEIPYNIRRVFFVRGDKGAIRGMHAHRECSQFLICLMGKIRVVCDDGSTQKDFELENPSTGLLIPPGIWSTQAYESTNSVLAVLCDKSYDPSDYIREYDQFLAYTSKLNSLNI